MPLCDLPQAQLYVHSSGKVFPCSFLQRRVELGDVTSQTLVEIWRGEPYERFRRQHEAGLVECANRQRNHNCHLLHRDLHGVGKETPKLPRRIDVMVDSACNLECVMCTSRQEPRGGLEAERFWRDNDEVWTALEELEVVGGEPLLSPVFFRLANMLLKQNPECRWRITTNANYEISKKLEEVLLRLKVETFAVSVDSMKKDIFERIRRKSRYETVISNVVSFREMFASRNSVRIVINFVVQDMNALELPDAFRWAAAEGFALYPILLRTPPDHSIFIWPEDRRLALLKEYLVENRKLRAMPMLFVIRMIFESLLPASRLGIFEEVNEAYAACRGAVP